MVPAVHAKHLDRASPSACPDCAMPRLNVLASVLPPRADACAFRCVSVQARAPLPPRWFKEFRFGVVRRGIIIRQRLDRQGRATAVDAVGTGGLVPLATTTGAGAETGATGYAATDVLLCACSGAATDAMMAGDTHATRDLLQLHAQAMDRMERLADARGRTTVIARVAAVFAALSDSLSPLRRTDVLTSAFQQSDLAALVAARQETVCRAVRALERRGVIARDADGTRIVDRDRLDAV